MKSKLGRFEAFINGGRKRKITSLIISSVAAATICVPLSASMYVPVVASDSVVVAAQEVPASVDINAPATLQQENYLSVVGEVIEISDTQISIKTEDQNDPELSLNIDINKTYVVDNTTRTAVSLKEINKGDTIYATISQAMTLSIPPQSYAHAIIVNVEKDKAPAHFITVGQVTPNEDGSVTVLSEDQGFLITILPENPIAPYKTRQIVSLEDIQVGTELFAWFELMTLSLPAQATADAVLLGGQKELPLEEQGIGGQGVADTSAVVQGAGGLSIADLKLSADIELQQLDGVFYLPLRPIVEALGLTINWNEAKQSITIELDGLTCELTIGSKTVSLGDQKLELDNAPVLIDSKTHVPMQVLGLMK